MNEMPLNGKLFSAVQCLDKHLGIDGISVRCYSEYVCDDRTWPDGSYKMIPVPEGVGIRGKTQMAVPVQNNEYQEMNEGDWYVVRQGEQHGVVITNDVFQYMFKE